MEEFAQRTGSSRRRRRKAKANKNKVSVEPVLIAARRPDSPLIRNGSRSNVVASAQPKRVSVVHLGAAVTPAAATDAAVTQAAVTQPAGMQPAGTQAAGTQGALATSAVGAASEDAQLSLTRPNGNGKRRDVRIVQLGNRSVDVDERRRRLLDRLVRAEGRSAISRVANDLADGNFGIPKEQELQLQLLEHENEERAREAVFIMAELLQKQPPIKRPILDQRLRRLEEYAEDPITRDAAAALRKSIRLHHG
jgi:hypothetical protein